MLSRRLLPDSPELRLEFALEFLRLFPDSPLPRRDKSDLAFPFPIVDSRRDPHKRAMSDRKSEMAVVEDSRRLEDVLFIPESAELSLRFLMNEDDEDKSVVAVVVLVLLFPQGKLFARSARVSLRHSCACLLPRRLALVVDPPHSRRMSVSWARELRLRRTCVPESQVLFRLTSDGRVGSYSVSTYCRRMRG